MLTGVTIRFQLDAMSFAGLLRQGARPAIAVVARIAPEPWDGNGPFGGSVRRIAPDARGAMHKSHVLDLA
jgi:hypothetical protein